MAVEREFYSLLEVVQLAQIDQETFRQALMRGDFPAYIELHKIRASFDTSTELVPQGGTNRLCTWRRMYKHPENDGWIVPRWEYLLSGWFRLTQSSLRLAAGERRFSQYPLVEPPSESLAGEGDFFELCHVESREHEGSRFYENETDFDMRRNYELLLWFNNADIKHLRAKQAITLEQTKPSKLRSDREQNLLRVIAGLWALAELPPEHNTAADRISGLITSWGWDKPAAGTIADTVLSKAANLPGARIRN